MRRLTAALVSLTLVTAACSSDQQMVQPTGPTSVENSASAVGDPGQTADSAEIATLIEGTSSLIHGLFGTYPNCSGNCNAAMSKFDQISKLYTVPPPYDLAAVVSHTYDLINWILAKYHDGSLQKPDGYASVGEGVTALVNLLYTYAGIEASICDLGKEDCDITFYQPGSPTTTLQAPSGFAQLLAPPGTGTVTQPTVLSVYRLTPDNDLTMLYLATQLDQYPLQYEFSTSSGETFIQDVTLTVCLADGLGLDQTTMNRLRLAHSVGPLATTPVTYQNIQILPSAGSGTLSCDTDGNPLTISSGNRGLLRNLAMRGLRALMSAVTPQPLFATTVLAGTGVTGTSKNLSPFGIVDPEANITNVSSLGAGAAVVGISVSDANLPKVRILTPNGLPMQGDSAIFTITAGGGSLSAGAQTGSSVVVYTDAQGEAALDSWTLGVGVNTLDVNGAISPCNAPVAVPGEEDCGTVVGTVTFTADGVPGISGITPATSPLPDGVAGVAYPAIQFSATGGDNTNYPYDWKLESESPAATGLSLTAGGLLSGLPSASGSFSITVKVTSGPATGTQSYPITIYPAPAITAPATLPDGIRGVGYPTTGTTFTASGGDGTYSWSLASGDTLPAGLSLSATTGATVVLQGTPGNSGSVSFNVKVTSGPATSPATATTIRYSVTIYPAVTITTASPLPTAIIGQFYSQAITAIGGNGSYTWVKTAGSPPAGLTFAGGTVSGTPTTAGTSNFTVSATSTVGTIFSSASKAFDLTVNYPTLAPLVFQQGPSGSQCYAVNKIMGPPYIAVLVTNSGGTPLNGVPVSLVAVLNNGSTVQVTNGSAITGTNGLAVFDKLSINKTGGYQLRASTGGGWPVKTVLSGKFKISPSC